MRIVSKFKDYYDFVGQIYRDEDPRSKVWVRKFEQIDLSRHKDEWGRPRRIYTGGSFGFDACELLIGDQLYHLLKTKIDPPPYIGFSFERNFENWLYSSSPKFPPQEKVFEKIQYEVEKKKEEYLYYTGKPMYLPGIWKNHFYREVQLAYKTPVLLAWHDQLYINPRLESFGIQHWIDPYQMHQNLSAWFSDGKFDSDPPDIQTDKQKIVAHGLDLKTSFRHPIK